MLRGVLDKLIGSDRLVIQDARQSDLDHLSQIHSEGFHRGWTDGEIEKLIAQDAYSCLIARSQDNAQKPPLGFAIIKSVAGEAEVITIAVRRSARNRGVARKLMDEAIRRLQSDRVESLFLEVGEENVAARKLYGKLGFKQVARREGYYESAHGSNPVPALVMQLDLG